MNSPSKPGVDAKHWNQNLVLTRISKIEKELLRLAKIADADSIHDTRVAGRRLGAALRHLEDSFRPGDAQRLRDEVGRVGKMLGQIRDLDILMQSLAPEARRAKSPFQTLLASLAKRRERTIAKVSPAATLLTRRLAWWRGRLETSPPKPVDPADFPRVYSKLVRRYFRRGRKLVRRQAGPEELHRFRIRTKRLRYIVELYSGRRVALREPLKELREIQGILGNMQDQSMIVAYFEKRLMDVRTPQRQTEYMRVLHRARMRQTAFRASFFRRWGRLESQGTERKWLVSP